MKKKRDRYIITAVLVLLIAAANVLVSTWMGFSYIAVSFVIVLALYWMAVFIYQYIEDYKWGFEEDFALYRAQTINATAISEQDFDMARDVYVKKFKKTLIRDKLIDISKMLVCVSVIVACIVAMTCK